MTVTQTWEPAGDPRDAGTRPAGSQPTRRTATCRNCPRIRQIKGDQLCSACWQRWDNAGRPDVIPEPMPRDEQRRYARSCKGASYQARVDTYADLTRRCRLSPREAAIQLGVSERSTQRYEAVLRQRAETSQEGFAS